MQADYLPKKPIPTPLTNSQQCSNALRLKWKKGTIEEYESVYAIYLNRSRIQIHHDIINQGNYDETNFNFCLIIKLALTKNSRNIITAHNHTSGIAKPSEVDIELTNQLVILCRMLGINLVDHIIITADDYYSFRDHGLIK